MRVTQTSGVGSVTVFGADISIPGLNTSRCSGGQAMAAGETGELFPEIYGDYPIIFDKPGQRLSGDALIVVRYDDGSGQARTIPVTAPITPGSLSTTYSGGTSNWRCG